MTFFFLSEINLQLNEPYFHSSNRKILKIETKGKQLGSSITIIKLGVGEFIDDKTLRWEKIATLPGKYDINYPFEIENESSYQFGYNPEDHQQVIEGKIVFRKKDQGHCGWKVFLKGKEIGHLFATLKLSTKTATNSQLTSSLNLSQNNSILSKISKSKNNQKMQNNSFFFGSTINVDKDCVCFLSLYASFPLLANLQKNRVFFEFHIGENMKRSAVKRIHQNQYRSYQILQLPLSNYQNCKLSITAYTFQPQSNKIINLGSAATTLILQESSEKFSISERVKLERIFFNNENHEQIGWMSFKYLKTQDQSLDPKFFLQDKFNTIGDINFRPLKHSSITISPIQNRRPMMSGLEPNSRIFIPISSRFQNPSKKKTCEQIGLSHQSVDLKDFPSHRSYKFATLGFGHKVQPVERDVQVPGPGRYQLPAIFDRFK